MKKSARVSEKLVSPGLPGLQVATRLCPLGTLCFCKTASFWKNSSFHIDEFTIGYLCIVEQHLSGNAIFYVDEFAIGYLCYF